MNELVLMLGITLFTPIQCPLADKAQAGWTAAVALQELAQQRGASEEHVGAVLLLWREDACDILGQHLDLLPQTQRALEQECRHLVYLPAGTEAQYIEAARQPIAERLPTLVSLAWAARQTVHGPIRHTHLVADGAASLRVRSPGYGRPGKVSSECGASPWALAVQDGL